MTGGRLTGIAVWDGVADRGTCDISWVGDRIVEVRAGDGSLWPDLAVIPGLVDTHVHLLGHAGSVDARGRLDTSVWPLVTTREERTLHGASNAQQAMRKGVTTLRDLSAGASQVAIMQAFDAGILSGPRMRVSGPVGMTGGHMDMFVPPAHPIREPTADSPDECRKLVRTWARAGMTGIKIATSGGVLSIGDRVGWRNQTRAEISATVDEAHALGMLVSAHAHSEVGIGIAIDEGVDSVEHGTELSPEQAVLLAAAGTPVAPTLLINELIAQGHGGIGAEAQEKAAELLVRRDALFADAALKGVRFVLGTDASGYFVRFGDQMVEVVHMAKVFSWSAERAMRAATSDAADAIGLGMTTGRLEPGLGADFIVVSGRPWRDIADLTVDHIVAVVCRGQLVAGNLPVG